MGELLKELSDPNLFTKFYKDTVKYRTKRMQRFLDVPSESSVQGEIGGSYVSILDSQSVRTATLRLKVSTLRLKV